MYNPASKCRSPAGTSPKRWDGTSGHSLEPKEPLIRWSPSVWVHVYLEFFNQQPRITDNKWIRVSMGFLPSGHQTSQWTTHHSVFFIFSMKTSSYFADFPSTSNPFPVILDIIPRNHDLARDKPHIWDSYRGYFSCWAGWNCSLYPLKIPLEFIGSLVIFHS